MLSVARVTRDIEGRYFLEFRSLCARKIYSWFPMLSRAVGENHGKYEEGKGAGSEKERRSGLFLFQGQEKKKLTKAEITSGYVLLSFSLPLSFSFLIRFWIVIKYSSNGSPTGSR